jgi:hypothetical protein
MTLTRMHAAAPGRQLLLAAAMTLAGGLAIPSTAVATDEDVVTCSTRTLRGVYLFHASGFNIMNGVAVPKAIIETLVFDGQGGVLTPEISLSANGNIIQPPQGSPGVYTLDADCTGTLTFGDGIMFDLQAAPYGKSVNMLQTNPGTVMQGSAEKVLALRAWAG